MKQHLNRRAFLQQSSLAGLLKELRQIRHGRLFRRDQHEGGAVGDAGGVAGGHRAAGAEDGRHAGERGEFQGSGKIV